MTTDIHWEATVTGACPHANVIHCPLYIAAHEGRGFGCDDGDLGTGECAVARGLSYAEAVGRLMAANPRLVAECRFAESEAIRKAQRARNMR